MHFLLILQLCLAPFFNFFPLSDLNIIYSKFLEKSDFFGKISDISDFSPKNRRFFPIFFLLIFFCQNRFHATRTKNRPKNPIFCSLIICSLKSLILLLFIIIDGFQFGISISYTSQKTYKKSLLSFKSSLYNLIFLLEPRDFFPCYVLINVT